MSNSIDSSERVSVSPETRQELNYRAVIDTKKCTVSGECIKVCEVNAIYEGPKRMPTIILVPPWNWTRASQWWTRINVTGVEIALPSALQMQLKWCLSLLSNPDDFVSRREMDNSCRFQEWHLAPANKKSA